MTEKEKMIEVIKKLLNLGDKTKNSNEAEAEAATAKAQTLLQKYNLDMADVIISNKQDEMKIDKILAYELKRSSLSTWEKTLSAIVATAADCKSFYNRKYNDYLGKSVTWQIWFYGTEWDREVAKELYIYLHNTILKMSRKLYKEMPRQRSFMEGFCYRLHQRVQEQKEVFAKQTIEAEKYALVLKTKEDAIDEYAEKLGLIKSKRRHKTGEQHEDAFLHGMVEGDKVDLGTTKKIEEEVK